MRIYQQAALSAKDGGLSLPTADLLCTFSASSRTTYMASLLGFGAVISDAAMIDRVIGMDVQEAAAARDQVPRRGYGAIGPPGRREVEGIGGRLWYELGV